MHKETEGSTLIDVQGVKCYVSKPPHKSQIVGSHLPNKEQYWRRTPLPTFKALELDW